MGGLAARSRVLGCAGGLLAAMLLAMATPPALSQAQSAGVSVPLMLAPHPERQGFVRIINKTNQAGTVRITAVDDGGNAAKGIARIGEPGRGHWRLSVETALADVRVLAFVRTRDGFLTAMHDTLPRDAQGRILAEVFNPGSNMSQASSLRLVNTGASSERVSIAGVDDQGAGAGPVALTLAAGQSRTISAFDLEEGASGLTGTLGDGAGKWRLTVTAGQSVVGMSLLETPTGPITNLSTAGVPAAAMTGTGTPTDDDHGDGFADATNLAVDGRQSGRIDPAGDQDYFRVRVTEAGTLTVWTTGNLDTRGYLYDANERQLASNDDGSASDGGNFRIQREVEAGTYYVRVEAYVRSATGDYAVHAGLETSTAPAGDDHGDSFADATNLAIGGRQSGRIDPAGDADYFRVRVTEAGTLAVYSTGSTDTRGYLYDANERQLASNDDGGQSTNFRIQRSVDAGTYYVMVRGYGSSTTGSYTVQAEFDASTEPEEPTDPEPALTDTYSSIFVERVTIYNAFTGRWGYALDYPSQREADTAANAGCGRPDCEVLYGLAGYRDPGNCFAFAIGRNRYEFQDGGPYGYAYEVYGVSELRQEREGLTKAQALALAESEALERCEDYALPSFFHDCAIAVASNGTRISHCNASRPRP